MNLAESVIIKRFNSSQDHLTIPQNGDDFVTADDTAWMSSLIIQSAWICHNFT